MDSNKHTVMYCNESDRPLPGRCCDYQKDLYQAAAVSAPMLQKDQTDQVTMYLCPSWRYYKCDYYDPTSIGRGIMKLRPVSVCPSVSRMPLPNSRMERPRNPKTGRMEPANLFRGQKVKVTKCKIIAAIAVATDVCTFRSSQRGDMVGPRSRTQLGRRSFHVAAPVVWNALPAYLRSTSISRGQFRTGLKTSLFDQAYNIL